MVMTNFSKQAIRFGMMFHRVRYTFCHFNTDVLCPFPELHDAFLSFNPYCYNMTKVNPFLTFYVFLVLLLPCRPVFYVTVCVFHSVTVQEEECCTQTISLCGFYFLLQAAKMGESDTYIFSIEVRALTGSYTLVKKKGT